MPFVVNGVHFAAMQRRFQSGCLAALGEGYATNHAAEHSDLESRGPTIMKAIVPVVLALIPLFAVLGACVSCP